jgi:hypothetical protein
MSTKTSSAVSKAKDLIEAWSTHNWDAVRKNLADDVRVQVNNAQGITPPVDTTGIDAYMQGIHAFADPIVPGSAIVTAAAGDDHTALVFVSVKSDIHGLGQMDLHGARLSSFDSDGKLKHEQVLYLVARP